MLEYAKGVDAVKYCEACEKSWRFWTVLKSMQIYTIKNSWEKNEAARKVLLEEKRVRKRESG